MLEDCLLVESKLNDTKLPASPEHSNINSKSLLTFSYLKPNRQQSFIYSLFEGSRGTFGIYMYFIRNALMKRVGSQWSTTALII